MSKHPRTLFPGAKGWDFCRTLCDDEVGYGDHAGSGVRKNYGNWEGQHWRRPQLYELPEPEQTLMKLLLSSLALAAVIEALSRPFWSVLRHEDGNVPHHADHGPGGGLG